MCLVVGVVILRWSTNRHMACTLKLTTVHMYYCTWRLTSVRLGGKSTGHLVCVGGFNDGWEKLKKWWTQEPLTDLVALSSSPAHAVFFSVAVQGNFGKWRLFWVYLLNLCPVFSHHKYGQCTTGEIFFITVLNTNLFINTFKLYAVLLI